MSSCPSPQDPQAAPGPAPCRERPSPVGSAFKERLPAESHQLNPGGLEARALASGTALQPENQRGSRRGPAVGSRRGTPKGYLIQAGCREGRHNASISSLRYQRPSEMRSHIWASRHWIPAPGPGGRLHSFAAQIFTGHLLCARHCDMGVGTQKT